MSIEEFIKELQKYPNQKAEVNFTVNMVNSEDDTYDVENCEVAFFQQDIEEAESYDIMIHLDEWTESKRNKHRKESIRNLLAEHKRIKIELDVDALHKDNILILNENDDVLREIEVGGRHYQEDNICIMLQMILA